MSDSLRFGLVGLGLATRSFHLPAIGRVDGVEIAAGCDASAERRSSWEKDTGTRAYSELDAMVEAERPDVVVVATPPDSHAELATRALEAGTHVFCEKPFVTTVEEADQVIAAAQAAGKQVAVHHEFRET